MKKVICIILLVFLFSSVFCLIVSADEIREEVITIDCETNNRNSPTGSDRWYRIKSIQHPESTTNYQSIRGYPYGHPDLVFNAIAAYTQASGRDYYRLNIASDSSGYNVRIGDVIVITNYDSLTTAGKTFIDDNALFERVYWMADNSSPYTQIRSTLSHYLFNDDFTEVPFGSGWIDMISTFACLLIFLIPTFVVIIVIKKIFQF